MKNTILIALLISVAIFGSGCASTYKPIYPPSLNYNVHESEDGIELSYKYDVLRERGNNKYARKETKRGLKLIAVKVTNNSDSVINIGKDVMFYSDRNQLFPLEPSGVRHLIKQSVAAYLPYLLLSFVNLYISKNNTTTTYPIGLIIGPGITIGNMAVAGSANGNFFRELSKFNILGIDIQKGETVFGIITIRDIGYVPIKLRKKH